MSSDFNPSNYLLLNPEIEIDTNITTVEQAQQHYQQYGQQQQLKYDLSVVPSQFNSTIYYNDCIAQNLFSDTVVIRADVVQYLTYNSQIQRLCLVHFVRKGIQIHSQDYTSLYIDVDPNFNYDLYTLFYKYTDTWTYIDTFNDYVTQIRNKNARVQQINDFLIASGENPVADFKTIKVKGVPINYISDRGKMFDVNSGIPANETISTQRAIKEYVDFHCRQYTVADVSTDQEYSVQYSNYKDLVFQQKISNQINNLTLKVDNKVFVKDQNSHKEQNGLYTVVTLETDSNYLTLTRTVDFDEDYSINSGNQFFDQTNNKLYICTNTTSISFSQLTPIYFDDYYYRDFETPQTVYQLYIINGFTTTSGVFSNQVSLLQDQSQPPLIVTSSNLVSNLNVQYLNGQPQSYYTNASNISSGTLSVSYGGTGINSLSPGFIPFGQGSNPFGSSSNLFWDSTNSRLGICNSIPQQALDIVGNIICSSNIQFSNQLISTIPSGISPFVVSSITLVSNLNVQYLNGQPQSFYTNSSNINSGVLAVSYGGTGVNNVPQGYIPFGQGTNSLGSTPNLFWNSASNYLGIGTTTPSQALDIQSGGLRLQSWNQISQQGTHIHWNRDDSNGSTYIFNQKGGTGTGGILFGEADTSNNLTQTMILTSNGYLGIGTSNPQSLLHVVGNILGVSNITANLQFISTITTGTPPLQISSTTLVSNLNVQYLNGKPETYYTNASNISSGVLAVTQGGTGINNLSQGYIPFGQNTGSLGSSSNLFWNSVSNFLGIGTESPASMIDINSDISNYPLTVRGQNQRQIHIIPASNLGQVEIVFQQNIAFDSLSNAFLIGVYNSGSYYSINSSNFSNIATFTSNGNVGIGTNTPSNAIDIASGGLSITGCNSSNIQIFSTSNSEIWFYLPNSSYNYWAFGQGSFTSTSNLGIGNDKIGNLITCLYSNGFIGIGTSNPTGMLDINATSNTALNLTGTNSQLNIYPLSNGGKTEIAFNAQTNGQSNKWYLGQATGSGISNKDPPGSSFGLCSDILQSNVFTILSNGYFGIGTSSPSNVLDVIGNIHASSNIIANNQLVSTVSTGIPPLVVTSSNLVSNLNVQYLNGQPASYYTDASNLTSGVLSVSQGGTGLSNLAQGYIAFGQGTSSFAYSSNLFWNSTSNYLGIGNNNPQNPLHVVGDIYGSYNIIASNQLISGTTTGTPPFRVVSTSIVSNLNVQYLNGNPYSYYTNATNINAGILSVPYGGTGITSMSSGYLHFGSNGVLGQSSNLYYNYTSNYLGVGTSNPNSPLYVAAISNGNPDSNGVSVFSSNSNTSPIISLRQFDTSSSNVSLGYISFEWSNIAGFSIGENPNSSTIDSNVTLDINNSWNFTGTNMMQFNYGTGFIGLRNPKPASLLDINASENIGLILRGTATQQYIYPASNGGKSEIGFCSYSNNTSNIWFLGQATGTTAVSNTFSLYCGTTGVNVFTALSNGYLGIGTSNPSYPLDVIGNIHGSYNIIANNQLVSAVSNGTAPIQVTSSTLVSNLNAQYLNGQPASYYTNASNLTSGTLSVPQGGTGLSNLSTGYIPFGQNTQPFNYSSNLFWDSTNLRLGIRNSNPQHAIDVAGSITCSSNIYYSNQLISAVITGTAPFVISSTTMVSNLNVQFLSGQSQSFYTNASNINSGILSEVFGGTGLSNVPLGQLVFGSNTQSLNSSSQLFFDSNSNQLQTPQVNLTLDPNSSQSPIIVSNSNMVSNLNAQYLGGKPMSYFSSTHFAYIPEGGTGLSNVPLGQILFGLDSQSLNTSSNLFFDSTSNQLQTPQLYLTLDPSSSQSPFVINNSNMISNLNAQYLGGFPADHFSSAFVYIPRGGTGLSNVPPGQILFGYDSNSLNTSSNFFWDQSNSRLGINISSPAYPLDVNGNTNIKGNLIVSGNVIIGDNSNDSNGSTYGALSVKYGGIGVNNIPTGFIPFGYNETQINYSSNFFWDFTNSRLGICNSNPQQTLDIVGNISSSSNIYFSNQLISTTATGTSPFNIASSTLVSNLNVQFLNSYESSYYTNASNISSGILAVTYGGTGINTLSQGQIPFGQGSNPFSSSPNLFWNSISNFLGIGTSNPSSNLDVYGTGIFRNSNNQLSLYNTSNIGGQCEIDFLNWNNSLAWSIGQNAQGSSTSNFSFYNGYTDSTLLTFTYTNHVGINTKSPSNALDVIGNVFVSSNLIVGNQIVFCGTGSPFTITSTALVSNLNVQYLNGQPSSYYTNASNISSGTLAVTQGGTAINNLSQGYIPFGQGSNPFSSSSNLFWDSTNFRLGIRNSSPQQSIDVIGNIVCSSNIYVYNQLVSSIFTGTAPLNIASTTLVSNLNVQFLNGSPSSYFTNASNINSGILNLIFGGTGLSFLQQGFIPFGQGSNSLGSTSNLFWDSTNFRLGIRNSVPQQTIDVIGSISCSSNIYFSNQLVSYISTGTAPLSITSTTIVSNLNVQYLNGQVGSYYTNASNISSGVLAVSRGGTGISNISNGCLYFASNNIFAQSSNLCYTSNFFGINNSNPSNALDMVGNAYIKGNLTVTGNITVMDISSSSSASSNTNSNSGSSTNTASGLTTSNGVLTVGSGGTGLGSLTSGFIPFGQGTSSFGTSSNLFWDSTNLRLGIRTVSPQRALDVVGSINCSSNIYFSNQLISTISTGTSPFTISSTTLVSNLNAQYLNGQLDSYYTNASNINSGVLNPSYGGTGLSNLTSGFIPFGQGSNPLGSSSNLFWDSSNLRLGVRNPSPQHSIDVVGNIKSSSNIYFSNQLVSTIATGTSPFSITSTTLVSNLNVQYLNGQLGSYYTNASNISSGILNPTYGGTGVTSFSNGFLFFGSNGILGQSSNLFWNSTSNYLGINTSNPVSMLDINAGSNPSLILRGQSTQQYIYPLSNGGKAEIGFSSFSNAQSNMWWIGQATGSNSISNTFGLCCSSLNTNILTAFSNGYIGIQNSSPSNPFDINAQNYNSNMGGGLIVRGVPTRQIQCVPALDGQTTEIYFNYSSTSSNFSNSLAIGNNTYSCGVYNLGFSSYNKGLLMTLQGNTGFLGIGTSNPTSMLDINAGNNTSLSLRGSNTQQWIYPVSNGGIAEIGFSGVSNSQSNQWYIGQNTYGLGSNTFSIYSVSKGTPNMTFLSNGNTGINNSYPSNTLDIIGSSIFRRQDTQIQVCNNSNTGMYAEIKFTNPDSVGWSIGQATYGCGASNFGFYNAYSSAMIMTMSGSNVGIGTNSPSYPLQVERNVYAAYPAPYGYLNPTAPTGKLTSGTNSNYPYISIVASGNIVTKNGEFNAASDFRLKTNIYPLTQQQQYDFVKLLKPVQFQWKKSFNYQYGFIAQDILKLTKPGTQNPGPCLINCQSDNDENLQELVDEDNFLSPKNASFNINYDGFIPILTSAIQMMQQKIEQQDSQMQQQNQQLKKQQNQIDYLFSILQK